MSDHSTSRRSKGTDGTRPSSAAWDAAEARLQSSADADLPVLSLVRRATEELAWILARSDVPVAEQDPPPPGHLVATALMFIGVSAHRAGRALMVLAASGYEPELLGLKRLLTELEVRMKAVVEDRSEQHARAWLVGPPPSTPHKLVHKHADPETFAFYSESSHADAEGIKRWLLKPEGENQWSIVGAPERTETMNVILVEVAVELRNIAVGVGCVRNLVPPGLVGLDEAIAHADRQYLIRAE